MLISEIGTIRKSWRGRSTVALVYPNRYHLGMSSLGFQTVYQLLNQMDDVVSERVFLPDDTRMNTSHTIRIVSVESGQPLGNFDIIAFSVSFENDYLNILKILDNSGVPLCSEDRNESHPMVIAGGVACFLNPGPISQFIDCFLIGEAEILLPRFFSLYSEAAAPRQHSDRKQFLKTLCHEMDGVYVPAFYRPVYTKDGTISDFEPLCDVPAKIKRVFLNDISHVPTCSAILTPDTTFDSTFLIEVSRGCPHGCRFCSAGYIYRPVRFRPISFLEECMNLLPSAFSLQNSAFSIQHSAFPRIGLLGAAVSDLPGIETLCNQAHLKHIRLSFSSLRADSLNDTLASALKQSSVKTATIAPDAGSQRMRDVINKGITEEHILNAAELLVSHGIPNLKLYFMIGLPTETMDDIEAIIELCRKIKHRFLETSRIQRRIGEITVSLNSFVPKPFTPFQWAPMDDVHILKKKIKTIQNGLKGIPNIGVNVETPRHAYIQALLSRGDRRISDLLLFAHKNNGNWAKTLKEAQVSAHFSGTLNTENYVYRQRFEDELFPWDFIDHGIDKSFLFKEYLKAKEGKTSLPCPIRYPLETGEDRQCNRCGVCRKTG